MYGASCLRIEDRVWRRANLPHAGNKARWENWQANAGSQFASGDQQGSSDRHRHDASYPQEIDTTNESAWINF